MSEALPYGDDFVKLVDELPHAIKERNINRVHFIVSISRGASITHAETFTKLLTHIGIDRETLIRLHSQISHHRKEIQEMLGLRDLSLISKRHYPLPKAKMWDVIGKKIEAGKKDLADRDFVMGLPSFKGQKFVYTTATKRLSAEYVGFLEELFKECGTDAQRKVLCVREGLEYAKVERIIARRNGG